MEVDLKEKLPGQGRRGGEGRAKEWLRHQYESWNQLGCPRKHPSAGSGPTYASPLEADLLRKNW